MTKAIRIHATGGPGVLLWEDTPKPEPAPHEAVVHQAAVGLNFIDVYFRNGTYKTPLPATLGLEAAGTVTAVGEEVAGIAVGDRVAYATGPLGAYATDRAIAADRLLRLPDGIAFDTAAAMLLQGLTAQYLIHRTHVLQAGETVLVHAAAGGVGLILCQWASHLGARVIGVVSSAAKAELARAYGAAEVIVGYHDLADNVRRLTDGALVPVVYDSIGRDTFSASLDCLAPLGTMVSYGSASGVVPPVDIGQLASKGSLFLTRPTLATYTASRPDLVAAAASLFEAVESGIVRIRVGQSFALRDAAAAHAALEARQTTGSTVLLP